MRDALETARITTVLALALAASAAIVQLAASAPAA